MLLMMSCLLLLFAIAADACKKSFNASCLAAGPARPGTRPPSAASLLAQVVQRMRLTLGQGSSKNFCTGVRGHVQHRRVPARPLVLVDQQRADAPRRNRHARRRPARRCARLRTHRRASAARMRCYNDRLRPSRASRPAWWTRRAPADRRVVLQRRQFLVDLVEAVAAAGVDDQEGMLAQMAGVNGVCGSSAQRAPQQAVIDGTRGIASLSGAACACPAQGWSCSDSSSLEPVGMVRRNRPGRRRRRPPCSAARRSAPGTCGRACG